MNEYRPGTWVHFIYQEGGGRYITLSGKVIGVWRNGEAAQCQYWIVTCPRRECTGLALTLSTPRLRSRVSARGDMSDPVQQRTAFGSRALAVTPVNRHHVLGHRTSGSSAEDKETRVESRFTRRTWCALDQASQRVYQSILFVASKSGTCLPLWGAPQSMENAASLVVMR